MSKTFYFLFIKIKMSEWSCRGFANIFFSYTFIPVRFAKQLLYCFFITASFSSASADDSDTGVNLLPGTFEKGIASYNPWAGVDDKGNLTVITGSQLAVTETGEVQESTFSPSVAVGDLNGDGLPDLVVADARGYFWFFPNSGRPNAPVFTHGEIMPIWLGGGWTEGDAIPRVQLVDFTGDKKLSIVAGNYFGGLYFIHNLGSAEVPDFRMSADRAEIQIQTHTNQLMWCNYLSPFLYDWSGTGRLDLVMGDGSYSANSIFLFENQGGNDHPVFNERKQDKIIPGMGREHLTPQVIDWNNDGKADIICGERAGNINVYLNQAADKTSKPVFDKDNPIHVMFGTTDKVGAFPTVCPFNFYHNNLFDLLVSDPNGHISCAQNIGTLGSPKFGPLVPLKGVNPYPKIILPVDWVISRYFPDGAPNELLECTNSDLEKDFIPPPDPFKGKGAMKFSIVKPDNVYFKNFYLPADNTRYIQYNHTIDLDAETRYTLSAWIKTVGDISDLTWHLHGGQGLDRDSFVQVDYTGSDIGCGGGWSHIEAEIRIPRTVLDNPDRKKETATLLFYLIFKGDGTLYLDDISLKKAH